MAVVEEDNYNHEIVCTLSKEMSPYELSREKRIRENLERMQKMGILDLTRVLRTSSLLHKKPGPSSSAASGKRRKGDGARPSGGLLLSTTLRRSSRLQDATPVTYSDILLSGRAHKGTKREKVTNATLDKKMVLEQGPRPEVYTEAHEKLLGSTERSWELFVDGCGKDGRRIYDPFKGKSCHQCRQKTLGHRTECSQCGRVQGQFCGDCLYMRYGEHVLEALENRNWICPVCRGICNCSLCRQAKGWAPTRSLYKKIANMGFKSVAHYLIETRRSQLKLETNADSPAPFTVKRSLPFSNSNCMDPPESNMGKIKHLNINLKEVDTSSMTTDGVSAHVFTKRTLNFFSDENNAEALPPNHRKCDQEKSSSVSNDSRQVKKCGAYSEPEQDSIGGRLRFRRRSLCFLSNGNDTEPEQPLGYQKGSEEQNECQHIVVTDISVTNSSKQVKNRDPSCELNQESIGGRLKLRKRSLYFPSDGNDSAEHEKALDHENGNNDHNEDFLIAVTDSLIANSNKVEKHGYCCKHGEDSIGGRLRRRKNIMLWT